MNKDIELTSPPTDTTSALAFCPTADYLAATSWDNYLRVWEVQQYGSTMAKCAVQHDAPPLCLAWSKDGTKLFSAGASKTGKLLDVATGQNMNFAQHEAPIKSCGFCDVANMQNILVTGSWDKTLKVMCASLVYCKWLMII